MDKLQTIEVKGQRVLTTKQIAKAYETEDIKIQQNFINNRRRFIEGKHYILLTGEELKQFKNRFENFEVVSKRTCKLYLWTEKGALLHAKSLNTDKAWEVYDYLVDFYFRANQTRQQACETRSPNGREVVDIPANETAQKGLQEVRRQIAGMECMLQMYNRYQSMEEYQKVVGMMQEFNRALYRNISDLYERRPVLIEMVF